MLHRLVHECGRLVELTVGPVITSQEIIDMASATRSIASVVQRPLVFVVDSRASTKLPLSVFLSAKRAIKGTDGIFERTAILVPADNSSLVVQLVNLLSEVRGSPRRVFQSPAELRKWLDDILDPKERAHLQRFLQPAMSADIGPSG
jgi:hypothetical protein